MVTPSHTSLKITQVTAEALEALRLILHCGGQILPKSAMKKTVNAIKAVFANLSASKGPKKSMFKKILWITGVTGP
jgi:hypothetical protein